MRLENMRRVRQSPRNVLLPKLQNTHLLQLQPGHDHQKTQGNEGLSDVWGGNPIVKLAVDG